MDDWNDIRNIEETRNALIDRMPKSISYFKVRAIRCTMPNFPPVQLCDWNKQSLVRQSDDVRVRIQNLISYIDDFKTFLYAKYDDIESIDPMDPRLSSLRQLKDDLAHNFDGLTEYLENEHAVIDTYVRAISCMEDPHCAYNEFGELILCGLVTDEDRGYGQRLKILSEIVDSRTNLWNTLKMQFLDILK